MPTLKTLTSWDQSAAGTGISNWGTGCLLDPQEPPPEVGFLFPIMGGPPDLWNISTANAFMPGKFIGPPQFWPVGLNAVSPFRTISTIDFWNGFAQGLWVKNAMYPARCTVGLDFDYVELPRQLVVYDKDGNRSFTGGPYNMYDLLAFTDELQTTAPIFFRLDYFGHINGSNIGPEVSCSYRAQVGTSNDSYNITGNQKSPVVNLVPTGGNGPLDACPPTRGAKTGWPPLLPYQLNYPPLFWGCAENSYSSFAPNRLTVAIGDGPDVFANLIINIERTKDNDGNDTDEGIIFQWVQSNNQNVPLEKRGSPSAVGNMVIPFNGQVAGHNSHFITPTQQASKTLLHNGSVAALPITPFNYRAYNPGIGLMLYYGNDILPYEPVVISVYGVERTYLPLNQGQYIQHTNPRAPTSVLMLWE